MFSVLFSEKLIRVHIAIILFIIALILPFFVSVPYLKELMLVIAWLVAGWGVFQKCLNNIKRNDFFDENMLMSVATIGAVAIGSYSEAVCVMVLYEIGECLQDNAVEKSKKSISDLIDIRPDYANVERNGRIEKVKPEDVMIGETIVIKAGEKIPLDGIITAGQSTIDVSSLTGESLPKNASVGMRIYSGCINKNGILKVKVDKFYFESTVTKLMNLIDSAQKNKSKTEKFITKFARIYTPIVLTLALLIVLIPFVVNFLHYKSFIFLPYMTTYVSRTLTFLVISCPCAFVISVPLTFFSGIGVASKLGVLIKGDNFLEALSNVKTAVFDKTGTLTKGQVSVNEIILASGVTREELGTAVLEVEYYSNHPIAVSLKNEFKDINFRNKSSQFHITEIPGKGMCLLNEFTEVFVGNKELMNEYSIQIFENKKPGTKIYVSKNKKYLGCVIFSDEIRQSAKILISQLKNIGVNSIMLTGDVKDNSAHVAKTVGIKEWYSGLMPEDKVGKMEQLVSSNINKNVIYVGDGINDAAVIARSDVGIAMGVIGSAAAIEAADIVITDDNLEKIFLAIKIAQKTMHVAKQNILFAIIVKFLFLLLGSVGLMTMWLAIFADTGVTLIAVLNAISILKMRNKKA